MADSSDIQQQISVLKFQLSVLGPGNPEAEKVKQQIAQLMQQLAFQKLRQGVDS